jgi:hypothetical protein
LYVYCCGRWADRASPCSVEVKNEWSHTSSLLVHLRLLGARRDDVTLIYFQFHLCGWLPTFRDSLSVPYSEVRQTSLIFLDSLTLEDGTDKLPRNVANTANLRRATSEKNEDVRYRLISLVLHCLLLGRPAQQNDFVSATQLFVFH